MHKVTRIARADVGCSRNALPRILAMKNEPEASEVLCACHDKVPNQNRRQLHKYDIEIFDPVKKSSKFSNIAPANAKKRPKAAEFDPRLPTF